MRVEPTLEWPCRAVEFCVIRTLRVQLLGPTAVIQIWFSTCTPPMVGVTEFFLSSTRPHHNLVTGVTLIMWDRVSSNKYCC